MLFLVPFFAFALSALGTSLARRLALRLDWVDHPASDRLHTSRVPLLGGVAVFGAFVPAGYFLGAPTWLIVGGLALCIIGLIDDIVSLNPRTKILCAIPLAVTAGSLIKVPVFLPWGAQQLAFAFWILTAINAYNLVDGLDGLAAGLGMITTFAVGLIAIAHQDPGEALVSFSICGALGGFLLYNLNPASIYLGDAGSLSCGFILGVLCLHAVRYAGESKLALLATPALLMAVPIIDTSIVTITRLATGRGISKRGLDHCHHRLHKLGLSQKRVVYILWGLGAVGAVWAVFISLAWKPMIVAVLPLCALMFATTGLFLANQSFEHEQPGHLYGVVPRLGRLILSLTYKRRVVEFALDFLVISSAFYCALLIDQNFSVSWPIVAHFTRALPEVCMTAYAACLISGIYRHIWRYTSFEAGLRFALASVLAGLLAAPILGFFGRSVPAGMLVLFTILLFNLLVATRMSFRFLSLLLNYFTVRERKILVVGAGRMADSATRELIHHPLILVGFLDNDVFYHRKLVHGHPVLGGTADLARLHRETGFNEILIAQDQTDDVDLERIESFAIEHEIIIHRYLARIDFLTVSRSRRIEALNGEQRPLT